MSDAFYHEALYRKPEGMRALRALAVPVGGAAADYAEVIWNEVYRVPSAAQDDVCDYPLARNLVLLATAVACETIVGFALHSVRTSYTITLGDLAVRTYNAGA